MKEIAATAPGKIVIAGEFAVLAGAPAISMAVNRRASVRIRERGRDAHTLATPGLLDGTWRFRVDGSLRWLDPLPRPDAFRLFECVVAECAPPAGAAFAYTVDTSAFHAANGDKLGLGSSAAVAVSLAAACVALAGRDRAGSTDIAARAHRSFQSGRGSGIDVATSAGGGVVRYLMGRPAKPLGWPEGLAYRALWSGRSSSTMDKLQRLPQRDNADVARSLAAASRAVVQAWESGVTETTLRSLRRFVAALEAYESARRVGIFEGGHAELLDLSRDFSGLVYKPTGAGGGDIGLALAGSGPMLDEFVAAAAAYGFEAADLRVDERGAVVEELAA
jgi:phosphomevalonate kinase